MGLQEGAKILKKFAALSAPLEPARAKNLRKKGAVFANVHFSDFVAPQKVNFVIKIHIFLYIMIFPFKIWAQSKRAGFKRKNNVLKK